jgi:hypothetical protein
MIIMMFISTKKKKYDWINVKTNVEKIRFVIRKKTKMIEWKFYDGKLQWRMNTEL